MQSVSSRIWTRVTVYISYDCNHYTTGISKTNINAQKLKKAQNELAKINLKEQTEYI